MHYFWGMVGVVFAGVIFNPNFTSRNSFYLRKLTPLVFGAIGWQWAYTKQSNH